MTAKMRDSTAPKHLIRAAIKEYKEAYADVSAANLDQPTISSNLAIVRGLYSVGESREACLEPAIKAAELYTEWVRCSKGSLEWSFEAELNNEFIGGVFLAGKADDLFQVWREARWAEAWSEWELVCLDLLCRAFGGKSPAAPKIRPGRAQIPPPMQPLVPMLQAMIDDDRSKFGPALVAFLTKSWGPSAEKGAKVALRSHWPLYTGKWSLLSAAACRKMDAIPEIPKKVQLYFPNELV